MTEDNTQKKSRLMEAPQKFRKTLEDISRERWIKKGVTNPTPQQVSDGANWLGSTIHHRTCALRS